MSVNDSLKKLALGEGLEKLEGFLDRKILGAPTGIQQIDETLLGLGALTILQGSPGSNKSTMALQIAMFNARQGRPALIVDEENGRERTRVRLLSQYSGRSETSLMRMRSESPADFDRLLSSFSQLPIYIASGIVTGPEELERVAEELVTQTEDYAFLIVDSIQALPRISEEERANLEAWSKALDRIKLQHDGRLIIIATSEKGYAHFEQASLAGAKGSSAISYKGELIADFRTIAPGRIRVEIVKNRDGARGVCFDLELQLEDPKVPSSFIFMLAPVARLPE